MENFILLFSIRFIKKKIISKMCITGGHLLKAVVKEKLQRSFSFRRFEELILIVYYILYEHN